MSEPNHCPVCGAQPQLNAELGPLPLVACLACGWKREQKRVRQLGRVRIELRAPPSQYGKYGVVRHIATGEDARVLVCGEDGTELELLARDVRVRISMGREATALLVVYPDQVDVEALARITVEEEPAPEVARQPPLLMASAEALDPRDSVGVGGEDEKR